VARPGEANSSGNAPKSLLQKLSEAVATSLPKLFLYNWLWSMPILGVLGVGAILVYTSQLPSGVRWSAFGTALVIGSSAYFTGGIVGFLFGIPRSAQGSTSSKTVQDSALSKKAREYQSNTNLEQVSDWLTKIIVGVGLVQIGHIVPALSKLAESMRAPLGGLPSSASFGLGLVISYVLLGFFYFYLWARELFANELDPDRDPRREDADKPSQSADPSP
jgi:hypothetical protein